MTTMTSYATDGRCHNANRGTYGHECGKPATWLGFRPSDHPDFRETGFTSGFCDKCKEHGDEARFVTQWRRWQALFTPEQLKTMRAEYSKIQRVDPCQRAYRELSELLDTMTQEQLKQLRDGRIPWLGRLAINRIREG